MKGFEELREVFRDDRISIAIGKILSLHIADDHSFLKVKVSIFPEKREIIALMSWESVGPGCGFYHFPAVDDMVLVAFAEGDDDQAFVIKRLSTKTDKIPENALTGDAVIKTLPGQKAWITSDTKVILSKTDAEPTQNLVLGQVFLTFMLELLQIQIDTLTTLATETHIGNLGFATSPPSQAGDYTSYKAAVEELVDSPLTDEEILSDIAFTEK